MWVVLFRPLDHKCDQWPLSSPPPSQLGTEALGVQRSHPGSRACTFGTSQFRHRHLLLLYPGDGWKDLPRVQRACSRLWRPAHRPGGEWMTFHFAWVLRSFHSGQRWAAIHPGSGWVPVCSCWGLADSCPAACQRLPWMESQFGAASAEVIYH